MIPPASLSAKPDTRPGPSTASVAISRTRHCGMRDMGRRTPRRRRRGDGPLPPPSGVWIGVPTIAGYLVNTRGSRRFQAVGMTVSMASSTVTMPMSTFCSSTTGTASRL